MIPQKKYLTTEVKAAILNDNERLSGSMHSRAVKLAAKYGCHRITISKVIRHTITRIKRPLTEDEKQQIRVLCSLDKSEVETHRYRAVSSKTGISANTIRLIIKEQEKEPVLYFNPKMEMF